MNPESIVTANSAAGAATIASSGLAVAPARWAVRLVFCVLALLMICGKAQAQNLASTFQVQQPDLTFVEGVSRTVRMTAATPGNFEGEALPLGRYHFYLGAAEAYHANFENLIRFPAGGVTFSASGVVLSFGSDMSEQTSAVSPGDTNYGINTFDPFYTTSTAGDNRLFVYDTISPAWNGTYTWANDGELDGEIGTTFTITVLPFAFPDGANPGDQILAKTEMATFTLGNIETTADIESYTLTAGGTVNGVAVAQRIITHGDTIISGAGGGLVYISESGAQTGGGVAAEGSLSGTPNVDADITLTYTAYAAGASKSFAFRIQLYGPSFPTPQENLAFTAGIASPPITFAPVRTSTESVTYTLTRIDGAAIPAAAFSIFRITDAVTEINSETALTVDDAGAYRLTATDNNGETATSDFTIAVSPPVAFPSDASPGNVVLFQGAAVTFSLGNAAGGQSPIVYTLTSNGNVIADGASLPFGTGSGTDVGITYIAGSPARILGTPGAINSPGITATYTVTDANGSTDNFEFNVISTSAAFPQPTNVVASYTVNEGAYTIDGVAEFDDAFTLPEVDFTAASATATYSSGGTLATGLTRTLNLISGTPTVAGAFTYLYIAHRTDVDTANVATFNYIAHVAAAPSFPMGANPGPLTMLQGAAAVTVTLGNAVGGVAPYAYETLLIFSGGTQGGDELVAGSPPFEAVQAYIAATASTPAMVVMSYNIAAEYTFIHNVNDAHAVSAAFTFAFTIEPDAPKFAAQADLHYTAGHSQSRNLVASPSGTAPLAYTITRLLADDTVDMLPAGFTNISIPEQPSLRSTTALTEAMAGSYILTAMDSATPALSGSVTFNVVVAPPLVAGANPGDTVVQVMQPFSVDMGKATGGRAPLRYEFRRNDGQNDGILLSGFGNAGINYDLRGASQPAHVHSKDGDGPTVPTTWRIQFRTIDANGASSEIAFVLRAVNAPTFGDGTSPPGSVNVTYTVNDPTRTSDDGSISDAVVVLPAANGGAGDYTYSTVGSAPGLNITPQVVNNLTTTAHLSGTPTTVGDYTIIRIATDSASQVGTYTVNIRVNERPSFVGAQPLLQTTLNIPLAEPLTLLAATNGSGDFSYTLDASLPTGLTFSGRTISGTPTVAADARTFDFTMSAVDAHGVTASNTLPFKLEIIPALAFVTPPMMSFAFLYTKNVAYTLPAVSNGTSPYTYSVSNLPGTGLAFDTSSLELSGTVVSTIGGNYNYTAEYKVVDADGTEVTAPIGIGGFGAINFDGMLGTALNNGYSFRSGTAANIQLPEAAAGTSTKTYSLTEGASFGAAQFNQDDIAFNPANRRITGTPNNNAEVNYALTYHATDIAGGNTSISTHTNVFIAAQLRFLRAADSASVSTFSSINLTLPQVENSVGTVAYLLGELVGGTVNYSSYTLPGTGATQVTFISNTSPQTIGGVTDGTVSAQTFVYTATDNYDGESVSTTFTIAVNESPAFSGSPFVVTYTLGEDTFTRGGIQYNELTLPAATEGVSTGSGTAGYTRDGNLPRGLTASSDSGIALGVGVEGGEIIITGRPSTSGDFIFYRIATDSLGEPGTFTLNIHVAERPAFVDEFETIGFTVGNVDRERTLPAATLGAGTLAYSIVPATLPAGLSIDLTTRIISGTPTVAAEQSYSWFATDENGARATGRFTLQVAAAFTEIDEGDERLTTEIEVDKLMVELPYADGKDGGGGTLTFSVVNTMELTPGVSVRKNGILINDPIFSTIAGPGDDFVDVITYTVTDNTGEVLTVAYTVTYNPIVANPPSSEYVIPTGSERVTDLDGVFTRAKGGNYTYIVTPLESDSTQSASGLRTAAAFVPADSHRVEVASGLLFDPKTRELISDGSFGDGDNPTLVYEFSLTFTVGANELGAVGDFTKVESVTFTLSVDRADELTPINTQIISKVAAASVAGTLGAITDRIATANIAVPEFSIGGKSPQAALAHGAQLYVNDRENFDRAKLIGNSRFVMPITAAGDPSQSIWASGAVWGSANYRSIDGDANKDNEDKLDWRGTVNGLHLGFDVNVHKNVLFGLAFSRTDGNIDYTLGETAEKGEYEITINSVYPYLNWQLNAANVWASVGSGSGEVVIRRPNAAGADNEFRSDVDLIGFGMGVSNDVSEHFELRAELRGGEFQIQGGNEKDVNRLHEQQIKTNTARLLARWHDTNVRADSNSAFMEFGLRSDGGDGSTGTAAEGALGWKHFGQITSLEIAAHGLFGRRDYHEWGAYGQFRMSNGADGQGLGLRVRPSYGEAEREFGRLWDTELIDDLSPSALDSDDYQWRTESRLSYGIQSARGLIAPFGEIVSADDDIYRLGVDWTPRNLWMRHIDLNLTGEQHNRENNLDERRVLLQGEVKF